MKSNANTIRVCNVVVPVTAALAALTVAAISATAHARQFYVATNGRNSNPGTAAAPFRTIQRAADLAEPGDVITVRAGIYRERVNPPRGGASDARRIVYQAAPGQKVIITGADRISDWTPVKGGVWKTTLPNSFFGRFNPYTSIIQGNWCSNPGHRCSGAVYLNGHWLTEATSLGAVLKPIGTTIGQYPTSGQYLLNVAWIRPAGGDKTISAGQFAAKHGSLRPAPRAEGGECLGWIKAGDWVSYNTVDFGKQADRLEISAASAATGGTIALREGSPAGKLLGTCVVASTGGWQSWQTFTAKITPTSGMHKLCLVFNRATRTSSLLWFSHVNSTATTIWAQFFRGVNPNKQDVEINVRQTVFYPNKTGINYITVRGFVLQDAATPFAPPTAQQIGLIGPNWSKGWIIEHNLIRYSMCAGVSLGRLGDRLDNSDTAGTAQGFIPTINDALAHGWNSRNIGDDIVRDNTICHCEQDGIVGAFGGAFCHIYNNDIYDIHIMHWFSGAEMAGIKLHGAVDTQICDNYIHHCSRGLWLDWMAQGARISRNLFADNGLDLFFEVDHGPILVDNNLLLSGTSLADNSQGLAIVQNLFAGGIDVMHFDGRQTPFFKPHSTKIAGYHNNPRGNDRYYNNIFVGPANLSQYNNAPLGDMRLAGNVYLAGAKPSKFDKSAVVEPQYHSHLHLVKKSDGWDLHMKFDRAWIRDRTRSLVTTSLLGKAVIPDQSWQRPDGSPLRITRDYFGKPRHQANPAPGPFADPASGMLSVKVWPRTAALPGSDAQGSTRSKSGAKQSRLASAQVQKAD